MKKCFKSLFLIFFSLTLILSPLRFQAKENTSSMTISCNKACCQLRLVQQKLWIDHISWTRSFIVSDLASLKDKDAVLERLLKNQDDIGNSFKPYYGEEIGNKLSKLLREHIEIAGQVVAAAKNNDSSNLGKYNKLWYENADQIAAFLSRINPNYQNEVLQEMLYKHLQLLTDQVVARLNADWKADIKAYDEGEEHMIMFADLLAMGIMKQFPESFK